MSGENGKPKLKALPGNDKIDQAIAASNAIAMASLDVKLANERPVKFTVPADVTDGELLMIIGVIPQFVAGMREQAAARRPGGLWVPPGKPD